MEKIRKIIRESLFREEADWFEMDGENYDQFDKDTIPFFYYDGKIAIGSFGDSHIDIHYSDNRMDRVFENIKQYYYEKNGIDNPDNDDRFDADRFAEEEIQNNVEFNGRIWVERKIMSFWRYPDDLELVKIVDDLNNSKKIKTKIDGSWKIYTAEKEIQSLEDYTGGEIPEERKVELKKRWQQHIDSAMKKKPTFNKSEWDKYYAKGYQKTHGINEIREIDKPGFFKKMIRKVLYESNEIDEAFIGSWITDGILKTLGIDPESAEKLGEGDNGIAFKVGDKTIKISYDSAEAEFAEAIKGHQLETVSNVYEVYEYDIGHGEDNRNSNQFSRSRYFWVIIKEFIPHKFGSDYSYGDALRYFDSYQERNFDYSEEAFDRMINEYRNDTIEMMSDDEDYNQEDDYELEDTLYWFEFFKQLHIELHPLGILSASDMKGSNMGHREDGEPVYLELHIYKTGEGYKEPVYKKLS